MNILRRDVDMKSLSKIARTRHERNIYTRRIYTMGKKKKKNKTDENMNVEINKRVIETFPDTAYPLRCLSVAIVRINAYRLVPYPSIANMIV